MDNDEAAPNREPPRSAPTPHNISEILSDSPSMDRTSMPFAAYSPEKMPQGSVNAVITQPAFIHSTYPSAPHASSLTPLNPFHPFSAVMPAGALGIGKLDSDLPPPLPVPLLARSDGGMPPALKPLPAMPIHPRTSSMSSGSSPGITVASVVGESIMSHFAAFGAAHTLSMAGMRETGRGTEHSNKKQSSIEKSLIGDFTMPSESSSDASGKLQDPRAHGLTSTHPRLKVEDALGYLDQVKIIFNHKPKVYNDFLDIMKEFKSQSLDTPGVIGRVASLFKGHADLIVGFNAFLPHGYKIDIDDDEIVRVTVPGNQVLTITEVLPPPSPGSTSAVQDPSKSQSPASTVSADSDDMDSRLDDELLNARPLRATDLPLFPVQDADARALTANALLPESGRAGSRASAVPSKGVEFDYAINYVNKIKDRFKDEPARYKRFLEILHAYQGKIRVTGDRPLDETDVYKEVDRLFGDHPDLMDDFSRFLPNACAMGGSMTPPPPTTSTRTTTSPSRSTSSSPQPTTARDPRNRTALPKSGAKRKASQSGASSPQKLEPKSTGKVKEPEKKRSKGRPRSAEEPDEPAGELVKPVRRYNKQTPKDKSIKTEALDMSKKNGRNPSSVRMARGKTMEAVAVVPTTTTKTVTGQKTKEDSQVIDDGQGKLKMKKSKYKPALIMQRKRSKRMLSPRKVFQPTRRVSLAEAFTFSSLEDFNLLHRIQRAVPVNVWHLLLKMFELYNSRAITKGKLLEIVEKLVYHKPKLVQEFAQLLQTKAVFRSGSEHIENGACSSESANADGDTRRGGLQKTREPDNRIAEFDFKAFERFTESRSYRIRPETNIKRKSSGSTQLDRSVLNDKYVSCPMFSEGSQFTISKKNSAEEVMFKCEDEKYEMDMLLSGAEAAMDAMTFVLNKLTSNSVTGKLPTWDEAFLHRRVITKLYGENAPIILSHLKRSPACAIPTVLERIKQKHSQWIRVQNSMSEIWMEQARRNASKIGDYKGITFKQTDMRFLRSRHLVYEMEKLHSEQPEHPPVSVHKTEDTGKRKPEEPMNQSTTIVMPSAPEVVSGSAEEKAHLTVRYPKSVIVIDDATFFLLRYIKQCSAFNQAEKKQMNRFLLEYLFRCLKIPDSSGNREAVMESSDDETDNEGKSPRSGKASVPRLSDCTSDEEDHENKNDSDHNNKRKTNDGEAEPVESTAKKLRPLKEFPILPLPWPELCQYTTDLKSLDSQVDEELTMEAKKREQNRERIAKRLTVGSIGDALPADDASYVLIYGNAPFFLFVRYHQILCDRFSQLYNSFQSLLMMETGKQDTPAYIVSKACRPRIDIPVERFWIVFMDRLLKLLDGNIDPTGFEEEMREIFRKDAYLTFTLDRLIQSITRQLHHIIAQDRAKSVRTLWEEARVANGAGGLLLHREERGEAEKQYEARVADFLKDQNCFKMTVFNSGRVCLELIVSEEPEDLKPQCRTWKDFVAYHATNNNVDDQLRSRLLQRGPVFIVRHHRQFSRHRKQLGGEIDEEEEEEEDEDLALDSSKTSKPETPADFSLDDRSWLMSINIRSQIESGDILGRAFDKTPLNEWLVYRRGAQKIAAESHRRVSQRRTTAFKRYLSDVWTKKALISQEKHKAFLSMMRENMNRYKQGNSVDPPYFVYYLCRSDESERLDDAKPFWIQSDAERASAEGEKVEKEEATAVDTAQSDTSEEEDTETDKDDIERKVKQPRKRASVEESN
ncbi:paired amphipathic helix protein Sin3b-like [Paramacrobiotus metropolitanus]|uniref:paired amphipathic helix protein Sin3b-like n=1 Tax=Paramacrobiotus metropolitanus TaxID=2943436 RepID=UPI00244634B0|nr:paired amphipathic helix protein Sin3b-like [Paramacrobiotus metropolitanus]